MSKNYSDPALFSGATFDDVSIHFALARVIKEKLQLDKLTKIQDQCFNPILEGNDVMVQSMSGTGKTLAYVVPVLQRLIAWDPRISREQAICLLPTRELAIQVYNVFEMLVRPFGHIVVGIVMGGEKKKSEKARLRKGCNILVSTPGRLCDHLAHSSAFKIESTAIVVLDEADKLIEQGFETDIKQVMSAITARRTQSARLQCVMLSATLSHAVVGLATLNLVNPTLIGVDAPDLGSAVNKKMTTPSALKQFYTQVDPRRRLVVLMALAYHEMKFNEHPKGVVFVSSCDEVIFLNTIWTMFKETFSKNDERWEVFCLHGQMTQKDRTDAYFKFCNSKSGLLMCTDVAARGLDMPSVSFIIQYDPPGDMASYVHRIGRTSRMNKNGMAVVFLREEEMGILEAFKTHELEVKPIGVNNWISELCTALGQPDIQAVHRNIVERVEADRDIKGIAIQAYRSALQAYASYPHAVKKYLPFNALHLGRFASSFCLAGSPKDIANESKAINAERRKREQPEAANKHKGLKHRDKLGQRPRLAKLSADGKPIIRRPRLEPAPTDDVGGDTEQGPAVFGRVPRAPGQSSGSDRRKRARTEVLRTGQSEFAGMSEFAAS